jgi:hypothetical protein
VGRFVWQVAAPWRTASRMRTWPSLAVLVLSSLNCKAPQQAKRVLAPVVASPPVSAPATLPATRDCARWRSDDDVAKYTCKLTEVLAAAKIGATVRALHHGNHVSSAKTPDATLLVREPRYALTAMLVADLPADQRVDASIGLEALRAAQGESANLLLLQAGVRAPGSLAAAATQLIDTTLTAMHGTSLTKPQLADLLTVIDEALAPTFRTLSAEEKTAAFDALLIEAGTIARTRQLDPYQGIDLALAVSARFDLP